MLFLCFPRVLWRTIDSYVFFGIGIGELKEETSNTVWYSWVYTFGGALGFASRQMGRNQRLYSVTVWALRLLPDEILWELAFILENAGINFAFTIALTMVSASSPVTEGQENFFVPWMSQICHALKSCSWQIFIINSISRYHGCCSIVSSTLPAASDPCLFKSPN